jgi:hypothetical protein
MASPAARCRRRCVFCDTFRSRRLSPDGTPAIDGAPCSVEFGLSSFRDIAKRGCPTCAGERFSELYLSGGLLGAGTAIDTFVGKLIGLTILLPRYMPDLNPEGESIA